MTYPYCPFAIAEISENEYELSASCIEKTMHFNKSATDILELCNGSLSLNEIVDIISHRYGAPVSQVANLAKPFLNNLAKENAVWFRNEKMRWFNPPPPQSIFWEITSECNLRCLHCVVSAGKKSEKELSFEQCTHLIKEWGSMGVQDITFSGGEPLMRDDLFQLAHLAKMHGIAPQISTNGTLITPQVAAEFKRLGISPQVSVDGSNSKVYSKFRGSEKAFHMALSGIRILVEAGIEVTIGTVLSKHNVDDIENMLDLVEHMGASHFRLIPFIAAGRGKINNQLELKPEQVKKVTEYLVGKRHTVPFEIIPMEFELTLEPPSGRPVDFTKPNECGGAIHYCTVTPSGNVLPCHYFDDVKTDNVTQNSFSWIWEKSRFLNYFRSIRIGDIGGWCGQCHWLADCRGGCRAANFNKGMLFQQNCHCWVAHEG